MSQKRTRVDSDESDFDSPEVKRLRDDLLSNLDDSDLIETNPDLDSFMRSFENEISPAPAPESDSGESKPDLGFLLGASDDELGIPPAGEEERVVTESLGELWRFEDELPSYDSFDYGDDAYVYNDIGYEYSDSGLDLYEAPIPLWRPETMPAL